MHRLNRAGAAIPACLSNYTHGKHNWDDIKSDKPEIRACLEQMQGRRCAYCEGDLDTLGQHIEHFRRKGKFPHLTFDWTNLYWSCGQKDSCGQFKDRGAGPYDVADLIDPCCDDPDTFFRFRSDGTIDVRLGLTASQQHRATETLRVFGLNAQWGRLRKMRKGVVSGYVRVAEEAVACGLGPDDLKQYFEQELRVAVRLPFSTAIRHVLTEGP